MQYSATEGARGICPIGFHIPTDDEWHTLEKFLTDGGASCISTRTSYGCSPAGIKLYTGGSSLFSGNSAGYVDSGLSDYRDSAGIWWSSSPSGGDARTRVVYPGVPRVSRGVGIQSRGYSIRCIQD